ncbi:MAG: hypothetical protein KIS84_05440 [Dokdonella sp.]|nr:hypothetical protein [Dokdonella sp.]
MVDAFAEAGVRRLHAADYRRTRWKNDGGWTTELAERARSGATPTD